MKPPISQNVLTAVVGVFAVAAVAFLGTIFLQQKAMSGTYRYDVSWSTVQAAKEISSLGQSVGAAVVSPDSRKIRRSVGQKFEILRSRTKEFRSKDFAAFAVERSEVGTMLDAIETGLAAIEPLLPDLQRPETAVRILEEVERVGRQISLLAASADGYTTSNANEDRDLLGTYWLVFAALLAGLLASLVALIVMNRRAAGRLSSQNVAMVVQNERFDAALNNMTQGLGMFAADGSLVVANRRLAEVLGIDPAVLEKAEGSLSASDFAGTIASAGALLADRPRGAGVEVFARDTGDGRTIAVSRSVMAGGGWLATFEDVTERRRHEEKVVYLATHDDLTGLPNRGAFQSALDLALSRSTRTGLETALICLDLNRFKSVNDTLGHHVGDLLLQETARRLKGCIREHDTVARLGGDEFSVIQTDVADREDTTALVRRLIEAVREPYDLDGHRVVIDTSAGIAIAPLDAAEAVQLMKNADIALYRSKNDGTGGFRYYESGMDENLQKRREMEVDLHLALERGEFRLFFQPIVDLKGNLGITCYETLVRWQHPQKGLVGPVDFIPVAEDIGLIVPLGDWIVREACRQAASWSTDARVAVNLSSIQFKKADVGRLVEEALAESGLDPRRLELEITESILMDDVESVQKLLSRLKARGVRIAMDDFGTGYSSLSYLSKFSFDKLKIDRSFVMDIEKNRDIIMFIATLGEKSGMTITAEGIETGEQAEALFDLGCHEGQGYHYSRPLPACDFPEMSHSVAVAVAA